MASLYHAVVIVHSADDVHKEEKLGEAVRVHGLPARTESTIVTLEGLKKELRKVRCRGYAIERGENEPMAWYVGAAVLRPFGDVVGGPQRNWTWLSILRRDIRALRAGAD